MGVTQEPISSFNNKTIPGFCEDEIRHSLTWYGEYVQEGLRFIDTFNDHVYTMNDVDSNRRHFTLTPCAKSEGPKAEFSDTTLGENYTDNICSLSGAMDMGDLTPLPQGEFHEIEGKHYVTLGEITLELDTEKNPNTIINTLDQPKGPAASVLEEVGPLLKNDQIKGVAIYAPAGFERQREVLAEENNGLDTLSSIESNVRTALVETTEYSKWTFEMDAMRKWVESHFEPGMKILNACAGKKKLTPPPRGEIIRNDLNPDRDADYHLDVAELAAHPEFNKESFDLIIFDPPWSAYQSNLHYDNKHVYQKSIKDDDIPVDETRVNLEKLPFETPNPEDKEQLGHARIAKEGFDYLLKPDGKVVQITFHTTNLPARLGYDHCERVIFNPIGEAKAVLGSVDRKMTKGLDDFL